MNENNNMIDEQKLESIKGKKSGTLSVIFILVALVAGITIGYFENDIMAKSSDKKTKQNNSDVIENSNSNVDSNSNSDENITSNVDSNSNVASNQVTPTVETKVVNVIEDKNGVPYVNIKGLESINSEITKEYNAIKGVKNASLAYSYSVRNNVLVLWVEYTVPVAMDANITTKAYYIDLTTNKQITIDNAITKLGVRRQMLMDSLVKAGYIENENIKDLTGIIIMPAGSEEIVFQDGIGLAPFINGSVE